MSRATSSNTKWIIGSCCTTVIWTMALCIDIGRGEPWGTMEWDDLWLVLSILVSIKFLGKAKVRGK